MLLLEWQSGYSLLERQAMRHRRGRISSRSRRRNVIVFIKKLKLAFPWHSDKPTFSFPLKECDCVTVLSVCFIQKLLRGNGDQDVTRQQDGANYGFLYSPQNHRRRGRSSWAMMWSAKIVLGERWRWKWTWPYRRSDGSVVAGTKKVKKNEYFKRSTVRHLQGMLAVLVEDEGVSLYYRPYCLPRPVARSLKAQKRPHG